MTDTVVGFAVLALAAGFFLASTRLRREPGFFLLLVHRWLRWTLFGLGMAYLLREWGISERPYWALAPAFMLVWMLLESIYTWLAVRALSYGNMPVYPDYQPTSSDIYWPVAPRYMKAKEEIQELGFRLEEKLLAECGGPIPMHSFLYVDPDRKNRLQVIFVPRSGGLPAVFFVFASKNGESRLMTDNVWLPFGGVFPADWTVDRCPFTLSPRKLFRRHQRNLGRWKREPEAFGKNLAEILADEQETLDKVSTEQGILVPRGQRPELGKLTGDGRYRIWKQILLLNYLGRVGCGKTG